jgi:hypothetical protein
MTSPVKGHNKGPIGPLDPDEPPPLDPGIRPHEKVTIAQATRLLRSMRGVEIGDRDVEYAIENGTGPSHFVVIEKREVEWGEFLRWASSAFPREVELTRKEAVEYLNSIGCPMSKVTLQQLGQRGPPYRTVEGRNSYYRKEDLDEWWAKAKATWPTQSFTPKYRPLNSKSRCPEDHRVEGHCPNIKHPDCSKYSRALCNVMHLPVRPGSQRDWLPKPVHGLVNGELVLFRVIEGKRVVVEKLGDLAWNVMKMLNPDKLQELCRRDWDK